MKKSLIILIALMLISTFAEAKKVALIEVMTGAWCGYCPEGTVQIEKMEAKYGDQVIAIKHHGGDGMTVPSYNELLSAYGMTGVPAGLSNRLIWKSGNNNIANVLSAFDQTIAAVLAAPDVVDVTTTYKIKDGIITGSVVCKVLTDYSKQLAFNLMVCENNVTGTGSGFDQQNYYSGQDHPYGTEPKVIKGYHHNNTLRLAIGGTWGDKGTFPAVLKSGSTYKWDFEKALPQVTGTQIKLEDVYVVGVVSVAAVDANTVPEVLDCVLGTQGEPAGDPEIKATTEVNHIAAQGALTETKLEITNPGGSPVAFDLTLTNSKNSPTDWAATIVGQKSITVGPKSKATVTVQIYPGKTKGTGEYLLTAKPKAGGENLEKNINIVHADCENIYIATDVSDVANMTSYLGECNFKNVGIVKLADYGDLVKFATALSKLTKAKNAILSTGDNMAFSQNDIGLLQQYLNNKVNVLVAGTLAFGNTQDAAVKAFTNSYGFEYVKPYKKFDKQTFEVPIVGVKDDAISDGITGSIILSDYLTSSFKITKPDIASPIFVYEQDKDSILALKVNNGGKKLVVFGCSFSLFNDEILVKDIVTKSMYWLMNDVVEKQPTIAADMKEVAFGLVEVNESKSMKLKLSNTGSAALTISSIKIEGDEAEVFSFDGLNLPLTVEPNNNKDVTIRFTPKEGVDYTAEIVFASNDKTTPNFEVALKGSGDISNVRDSKEINLSALPNPAIDNISIKFTQKSLGNVTIDLFDIKGNIAKEIFNGTKNIGDYTQSININDLPSGKYFVMITNNEGSYSIPITIVK